MLAPYGHSAFPCMIPCIQRFSHLDIPTKYQYLTGVTILIPTGRFFDTIIDVDY